MSEPTTTAPDAAAVRATFRNRIVAFKFVPAGQLLANPLNFRVHPKEQRDALRGSLDTIGWLEAVIVNVTTGHVIDGHARIEEALTRSVDEPVPVLYVQLTDEEERVALATLDPMAAMAVHDNDQLARLLDGILTGSDGLNALLASVAEEAGIPYGAPEPVTPDPDPVLTATEIVEPVTKFGDVIRLGWHVLMCGDSTDEQSVHRLASGDGARDSVLIDLAVTDPPYAVYGSSTGIAADITDDAMVRPFFRAILAQYSRVLKPFAHLYISCDWRSWASWWEVARGTPIVFKNCIVWDKGGAGLGSMYANTHEFIAFATVVPMRERMTQKLSGHRQVFDTNLWRADRVRTTEDEKREHNAQKPVSLLRRAIENSSEKGGTVLDLFGGAGSTLIACEQTGRVCYTMEKEPRWCDVIVGRWERATGLTAQRPSV